MIRWFEGITMTPARERLYAAMERDDEGLGPRAYRCLLQLMDGDPLRPSDVEWLTDGVEQPAIAEMRGGACVLTEHGRRLARAIEHEDVRTLYTLTTVPELGN